MGGHIPVMFDFAAPLAGYVQSGKLRPLMTGCRHRVDIFPDVPSSAEAGYPDLELISWGGIFAPRGTSAEIVNLLNREINKILSSPDVRSHVALAGSEQPLWTVDQFAEFIKNDRPRWVEVLQAAGVKPE